MTTKVIDKNEARVPFFGDKMSFVTGLDPLGLQNPSIQAYSHLLPGLNNVTSRIRNYSFYCWLLSEYAKAIESTDPKEQKKFIRRSEYLIALLSEHMEILGISGVQYARNRFKEGLDEFDLEKGTYNNDGSTINTYWQYSFGIFGQYYIGSLRQVGLIEQPVNSKGESLEIYRRTSRRKGLMVSGEDLASAFDTNLDHSHKTLFLDCIAKGKVTVDQLEKLAISFNLTELENNNTETDLLINLLLDIDEPGTISEETASMRKETIIHFLRFIDQNKIDFNIRAFTRVAYDSKGVYNNEIDYCWSGWYYYQFNEFYQYASTAIFHGCLDYLYELKGPGWMSLQELISESTNAILNLLAKMKIVASRDDSIKAVVDQIYSDEQQLYNVISKSKKVERMANGFLMIWKLYPKNKDHLNFLREYTNENDIINHSDVVSYYQKYGNIEKSSISEFISYFFRHQIINRHQYVAYRKMGGGSQSTQKFIIEDIHIRRIGNYEPSYTGPRLGSLLNFLKDLNLVTELNKLSTTGSLLLKEIES